MFENSMLPGSARRRAMTLGYVIEGVLLGLLVLFPLIHTEALPGALTSISMITAPPPPAAPQRQAAIHRSIKVSPRELVAAPVTVPNRIVQVLEPPEPTEAPAVGVPGSVPWGEPRGLPAGFGEAVPPPPAASRPDQPPQRVHIGGAVEAARVVFQPQPEYPQIAKMARVQGTVRLAAIITKDGLIESLKVLSGPPLLVKAAVDAVARWRYQPTLLNGDPVEVATEIDVNFVLNE